MDEEYFKALEIKELTACSYDMGMKKEHEDLFLVR